MIRIFGFIIKIIDMNEEKDKKKKVKRKREQR